MLLDHEWLRHQLAGSSRMSVQELAELTVTSFARAIGLESEPGGLRGGVVEAIRQRLEGFRGDYWREQWK